MNIITPNFNYQSQITNYKASARKSNVNARTFTGHTQNEKIFQKGFKQLIQQTAFDRESQTKDFVCNYIRENFGDKKKIKIVSAACSTGEEAVSYSMKLYDIKNKVDILGFDLGKKAIKQAKSREYLFEIPKNNYDFNKEIGITNPYTDTYLVNNSEKGLTASQKRFKSLFNEFFEPTEKKIRTPFQEWLQNKIVERYGGTPLILERKIYKLKDGMAENCNFIRGDVQDIDKILNGEKADVISFCNALYHLATTGITDGISRAPKKDSASIIEALMKKFKNCLNKNGIIVFGEDEGCQLRDYKTVPQVMKKLGFTPLNAASTHHANVWKLQ